MNRAGRRCAGELAPRGQAPHSGAGGEKGKLSLKVRVRWSQRSGFSSPCLRRLPGTWPIGKRSPSGAGRRGVGLATFEGLLSNRLPLAG